MALAELLRALEEQGAERREEEIARARETCEQILEASRGALALRREEFLSRVRRDEEELARRILSRARSEAARAVLVARGSLLDRVEQGLKERIRDAPSDRTYLEGLTAEIRDAIGRLPPGPARLRAPEALSPRVAEAVAGLDGVRVEASAEVGVGFVALSRDGSVEVDATLEARLAQVWPQLAVEVLSEMSR
jgi:vacuolar-type H+-ATPase subunit E/Vma4